jgi:hypothetical protein
MMISLGEEDTSSKGGKAAERSEQMGSTAE